MQLDNFEVEGGLKPVVQMRLQVKHALVELLVDCPYLLPCAIQRLKHGYELGQISEYFDLEQQKCSIHLLNSHVISLRQVRDLLHQAPCLVWPALVKVCVSQQVIPLQQSQQSSALRFGRLRFYLLQDDLAIPEATLVE